MKKSTDKNKVAKPVYFNITNKKEKELVEWIDSKFTSFGGLVKDLLYNEMIREKNGVNIVSLTNEIPIISDLETSVDIEEVENLDC